MDWDFIPESPLGYGERARKVSEFGICDECRQIRGRLFHYKNGLLCSYCIFWGSKTAIEEIRPGH